MSVILIADCLKDNSGSLLGLGNVANDEFTGISRNESAVEIAVSRSSLAGLGYGVSGLGDVIDCQLAQICSTDYYTYSPITIVSGCENAILY